MPIQFFCASCRRPIEIDDDAANQPVTCPYCQTLVTAPSTSDPAFQSSAVIQPAWPGEAVVPPPLPALEPPKGNKLSWASLICAVGFIACFVTANLIAVSLIGKVDKPVTGQDINQRILEGLKEHRALSAPFLASMTGICVLPLVALVLAIIALVRRRPPVWPAITALCLMGVVIIVICAGFLTAKPPATP